MQATISKKHIFQNQRKNFGTDNTDDKKNTQRHLIAQSFTQRPDDRLQKSFEFFKGHAVTSAVPQLDAGCPSLAPVLTLQAVRFPCFHRR